MGVGGTLSNADEKIPNNEDDECARLRLAKDKKDEFRLFPRPGRLNPELRLGESCDVDGVDDAATWT